MSADSKVSTQTVAPVHPLSANRKPSTRKNPGKRTRCGQRCENPERQAEFTTISAYPIQRLYTPADLSGWDAERDLGYPGEPPYTRGIHSTMHRGRLWTMRQLPALAPPKIQPTIPLLAFAGQTGLSTAFDCRR